MTQFRMTGAAARSRYGLVGLLLAAASPGGWAQASRPSVSGLGDDANPCSRTAPCRTFNVALARTASGDAIGVIDTGVFDFRSGNDGVSDTLTYEPLVITKPITIDGAPGRTTALGPVDSDSALQPITAQQDAIVINVPAGSTGPVILHNMSLHGGSGVDRNGVRIASASTVSFHNVAVAHFSQNCLGVDAAAAGAQVDIVESSFSYCSGGIAAAGASVISLGDSVVTMNTGTGLVTTSPQATVLAAGSSVTGNARDTVIQSFTAATPAVPGTNVGSGSASAVISGGAAGCSFASQQFTSPATVAAGLPATAGAASSWFALGGAVSNSDGRTFTYSVTDNGVGDSNSAAGVITDPVLPVVLAVANGAVASIPTLSEYGMALLTTLVALAGFGAIRRRPGMQSISYKNNS